MTWDSTKLEGFFRHEAEKETHRRNWAERTPATKADIEDAINNHIIPALKEAAHWMNVEDYKIYPNDNG